jgi:hypothetical protein
VPDKNDFPLSMVPGSRATGFLGILMLDTRFPRPVGDIGNPATFDFPVRYRVVSGASPQRVVREHAADLLQPFILAGQQLCAEGAVGISTSCGFLALFQRELAQALPVPVVTSSLLQVAWLLPLLAPGRTVGVVTIDAEALSADHLLAVGAPADLPIGGAAPDGEFAGKLLRDEPTLDVARAQADVVQAAQCLVQRRPDIAALVLECTNMPPYARAVTQATGRPVYDVVTLLTWFWAGLSGRGNIRAAQQAKGKN